MRIEISASQFSFDGSAAVFHSDFDQYIADADSLIATFAAVRKRAVELPGDEGDVSEAVEQLDARIREEEARKEAATAIQQKAEQLWKITRATDRQVADLVDQNQEELYRTSQLVRPEPAPESASFLEQAWEWLCGLGEAVVEGVKSVGNWVMDGLSKAFAAAAEFYAEHKKIIDTVLIVIGAVAAIAAVIATGGAALIPLLTKIGISAAAAAMISSAIVVTAVVSTAASSALNIVDVWAEIDDPLFNDIQMTLNTISSSTTVIVTMAATGGMALIPMLTNVGVPGAAATYISGAVGVVSVVSTGISGLVNIMDIWAGIDDPGFNRFQKFVNVTSGVSNTLNNLGSLYNAFKKYSYTDIRNFALQSLDADDITRGGGYATVRTNSVKGKFEAHECPAFSAVREPGAKGTVTERKKLNLPSVRLEKADHMMTKSWGPENKAYVDAQRALIESGRFDKAFQMDIKDLERFGFKYAKGISEMKKYAKTYMKGLK